MINPVENFPPIIPVEHTNEIPDFSCKLRSISEFNESIQLFKKNSFSILATNIRGMRTNFPHFEAFMSSINLIIDVIVLTEIFLSYEIDIGFSLPGYKSETLCRNGYGGGIKVYYRDSIEVTRLSDITFIRSEAEILSLSLKHKNLTLKLISVYRPPSGSLRTFNEIFSKNIFSTLTPNEKALFCEDFTRIFPIQPN